MNDNEKNQVLQNPCIITSVEPSGSPRVESTGEIHHSIQENTIHEDSNTPLVLVSVIEGFTTPKEENSNVTPILPSSSSELFEKITPTKTFNDTLSKTDPYDLSMPELISLGAIGSDTVVFEPQVSAINLVAPKVSTRALVKAKKSNSSVSTHATNLGVTMPSVVVETSQCLNRSTLRWRFLAPSPSPPPTLRHKELPEERCGS